MRWLGGALVPALVLAVGLAGCSTAIRPEVLQKWVGRPAADLKKDWGEPSREVTQADLRVLIYEEVTRRVSRDFQRAQSGAGGYAPRSTGEGLQTTDPQDPGLTVYVRSYLFWVNRDGLIVRSAMREP